MLKLIKYLFGIALLAMLYSCEKQPTAMFTASKTEIDEGESVTFTNKSTDADHYTWFFGEGSTSTEENPTFTYTKKGMYNVTLIAYSKSGKQLDDAYLLYIYVYQKTRLIFNIKMGGSPVSGCHVDVYGNSSDWSSKANKLADATTGADGIVTFTGCQEKAYYADFSVNNIIYYSAVTDVLTLHTDNSFDVTLSPKTLTFNNATFTPIKITVDGTAQQTIAVGGNVTYNVYGSSVHYIAETNETYSNGNQLGLKLTWDFSVSTPNTTNTLTMNASSSVCYFRITNYSGAHALSPIYFNYGNSSYQTTVNATIPADNVQYKLGYHYAIAGGQVRAYYTPSTTTYSYWNPIYAGTVNQYKDYTNSYKSNTIVDPNPINLYGLDGDNKLVPYSKIIKTYLEQADGQQNESNGIK